MTCASRPRSRAVPRPDAVQLADETARKPQRRAAAADEASGKQDREREAPTALKLAGGVFIRRGYREKMPFSSNSRPKTIASVPQLSDTGLRAFEYLAPHFTALMVGGAVKKEHSSGVPPIHNFRCVSIATASRQERMGGIYLD